VLAGVQDGGGVVYLVASAAEVIEGSAEGEVVRGGSPAGGQAVSNSNAVIQRTAAIRRAHQQVARRTHALGRLGESLTA
jgi:hypothetical protein